MTAKFTKSSGNIFTDLGFEAEEASSLKIRSNLMMEIERVIARNKWSQSVAATKLRVSQPRISDLKRGKIDLFSIETLIEMLNRLGESVAVQVVHEKVKTRIRSIQHAATNAYVCTNSIPYVTAKSLLAHSRPENMWEQLHISMRTNPEQPTKTFAEKGLVQIRQIESTGTAFDRLIDKDKLHIFAKKYSTRPVRVVKKVRNVR